MNAASQSGFENTPRPAPRRFLFSRCGWPFPRGRPRTSTRKINHSQPKPAAKDIACLRRAPPLQAPISVGRGAAALRADEPARGPLIAAMMGLGKKGALNNRIKAMGLALAPPPRIPRNDPPRKPDEVFGETTLAERADRRSRRNRGTRAGGGRGRARCHHTDPALAPAATERGASPGAHAAHALASLARTLQELLALL